MLPSRAAAAARHGRPPLRPYARSARLLLAAGTLLASLATLDACASGPARPQSREEAAISEAEDLCNAHVNMSQRDQAELDRQLQMERFRLSTGGINLGDAGGNIARIETEVHGTCIDQVMPALSGAGGVEAVSILREARLACEANDDDSAVGWRTVADCIHERKLEIFNARHPEDAALHRETFDRLLRVGGGAPLSPAQRAEYCRTRELQGSGHPICDD